MNTFMHGPGFFLFHFLSFSISFPKLTVFTILYVSAWRARCGKSLRSLESLYYSQYNMIGEHEITKLKKKIFASNPEKRTQKQAQ